MNREQEIQLQFLDEAQEYIGTLETALVGLSQSGEADRINAALRAAHSIKGGAGMMGFEVLSDLAHHLEDSLKVLKIQKTAVDAPLENLLLSAVERLHQVAAAERHGQPVTADWLTEQAQPIFDQLHEQLGDPQDEDAFSILSPEEGQDIVPMLFQTEIEESLTQFEATVTEPELAERLSELAETLGGLGEMLQLPAFVQLCESVAQHLAAAPAQVSAIAEAALQSWRRSQALVLTGHLNALPDRLSLPGINWEAAASPPVESVVIHPEPLEPLPELLSEMSLADAKLNGQSDFQPDLQPSLQTSTQTSAQTSTQSGQPSEASENSVRVPVKHLDRLNDLFGELTIERNGLDINLKRLRGLMKTLAERIHILDSSNTELRDIYDKVAQKPDLSTAFAHDELRASRVDGRFDALELDRYDELHLLSQEVMETVVQIQEVSSDLELGLDEAEQTVRELNKTARQLQTRLSQVRMRPLSDIIDRFPRALRELSLQYGKPVQLQVEGANTLIDRNILEALSEPLMHLVRNAFDHGIEPPELRQSRNKPEQGNITIRATHSQSRTLITLSDDGGGIPLEKVRSRARQMGLDELLLAAASDEDLLSLIFEPGFSTSDQVTALSGRGIGMDVVRERLKQVQGEIKVETEAGRGTTFTLSVPFTLSVMRVLLIESDGLMMAFPTTAIQEMIMLAPEQVIATAGNEAFTWQGGMVQLLRLRQWLSFNCARLVDSPEGTAAVRVPTVLLLPQGSQTVGLEVDRCWGEQEVAIRKIQGGPALPPGFSNCTILGDGRVVPLVSVPDLLRWLVSAQRSQLDILAQQQLAMVSNATLRATAKPSSTVLIVDDSINVRRFLALTLEKAGYRVIQARDGQDALDKLVDVTVQAVVCDIEMPRLDGYGFLARLKADPVYEQLPVAMLTTRSSDKHRQLALSLGATAYFSKPFNEQVLLQALEKMVAA